MITRYSHRTLADIARSDIEGLDGLKINNSVTLFAGGLIPRCTLGLSGPGAHSCRRWNVLGRRPKTFNRRPMTWFDHVIGRRSVTRSSTETFEGTRGWCSGVQRVWGGVLRRRQCRISTRNLYRNWVSNPKLIIKRRLWVNINQGFFLGYTSKSKSWSPGVHPN